MNNKPTTLQLSNKLTDRHNSGINQSEHEFKKIPWRLSTFFFTSFLCLIIPTFYGYAIEPIVLENATTKLVIKDNRIVSLYDKVRSIEHASLQSSSTPGLFNIQLVNGIQPYASIDATQMTASLVSSDENKLVINYTHPQVNARVEAGLSTSAGEIEWSISVAPVSSVIKVGSVGYPVFDTPVSEGGSYKNALLPMYEGKLHPLNLSVISWTPKVYPAILFAQMVGCIGKKGSFLLWTDDTAANVKEFKYTSSTINSRFSVIHRMPYEPGEWKSSYHIRISFSDPSWYDAADIYRTWASQQYWCASKFKNRTDMPTFLHTPSYHANVQLSKTSDADLLALPQKLSSLSLMLNAPVFVRGTYWEKRGGWVGIDYFPPAIGESKLLTFANSLKAKNIKLICEVTGYVWQTGATTLITTMNELTQAQKNELKVYYNSNGGPTMTEQDLKGNPSDHICRGSSLGKTFIQDVTKKLFDLGVTAYHHDSDAGPSPDGISGCFNSSHGHPIPCGPWSLENTRQAFREVKAEALRRGETNFMITKEYCTEQLNMEVNAYLARLSGIYTEAFIVPLTQFLYHEYLPIVLYNVQNNEMNDILVLGQIPGGSVLKTVPTILSDYYRSMNVYSRNFLLYGKMLKPLISGIPVDGIPYLDPKTNVETIINVPHVRQSAWMDDSGNIGVFAINAKSSTMSLNVPVPEGVNQATFYLGSVKQSTQTVTPGQILSWGVSPGRLQAIVFNSSTTAVEKIKRTVSLDLFPNPVTDKLNLISSQSDDIRSVKIYSSTGNLVKQMNTVDSMNEISVKHLPNGIYFIEVAFMNQMVLQKKFIKN